MPIDSIRPKYVSLSILSRVNAGPIFIESQQETIIRRQTEFIIKNAANTVYLSSYSPDLIPGDFFISKNKIAAFWGPF